MNWIKTGKLYTCREDRFVSNWRLKVLDEDILDNVEDEEIEEEIREPDLEKQELIIFLKHQEPPRRAFACQNWARNR